jgi:hypothetical protein
VSKRRRKKEEKEISSISRSSYVSSGISKEKEVSAVYRTLASPTGPEAI